ncbi:cell division protein FtsQ/DivIB [Saccharospirillum salsuginis]|uniref:Cell division protein FtsQ n=1 Tax=Saccharospirillum salsuginis TaxID=418750 RepID=A0A918K3E1_9GAMM|nr:cell division protein FtsQ/DivIB [Saccharospirillum salsuginis]GGX46712.1 cell division protein FtsQ [Saccharospirillum salsuginis]
MTKRKKPVKRGATKRRQPIDWRTPLRRGMRLLAGGIAVAVVISAGRWLLDIEWQPMALTGWQVDSTLVYEDRARLDATLETFKGSSLLTLSPGEVQDAVEALPWIDAATVTKAWPSRLLIAVREHEPVARWNGDQVLNSDGEPLARPVADLVLAELNGPDRQAKRVMEQYLQYSRVFSDSGYRLKGVRMHPRGAWDLTLDNGIDVALGSRDMLERTRRVVALLERGGLDPNTIDYIDARYPNGLAVGQRDNTEPSA